MFSQLCSQHRFSPTCPPLFFSWTWKGGGTSRQRWVRLVVWTDCTRFKLQFKMPTHSHQCIWPRWPPGTLQGILGFGSTLSSHSASAGQICCPAQMGVSPKSCSSLPCSRVMWEKLGRGEQAAIRHFAVTDLLIRFPQALWNTVWKPQRLKLTACRDFGCELRDDVPGRM